ncbi:DUF423 domain-containing protein [Rubrolithibacter danxiaensis]|uniref:DUF423 domain-containing protein n=1 Tax=Rubrolithibacter danxiaensis TaxID=3390805 RepID=UPI003BF85096
MNKRLVLIASISGILAVLLGAFGAHGLKAHLTAAELDNWKTGVNYQFYHTLALLFLSLIPEHRIKLINVSSVAFIIGIILFSGSLYLLSTRSLTGFAAAFLGPITPIGGLSFIIGWACLFFAAVKVKNA